MAISATRDDFRFEAARLDSFVGWTNEHVEPAALAAAGFYFTGRCDAVRCFECNRGVCAWMEGDDPLTEHRRFSELCRFACGQACGNVPLGTEADAVPPPEPLPTSEPVSARHFANLEAEGKPVIVYFTAEGPPMAVTVRDVQTNKYPEYSSIEARIVSFSTWPSTMTQTKKQLVDAGFYYARVNDRTICYYCGLGLEGWEPVDVPLLEHLKWAPKCAFALQQQRADAASLENATSCA